MNARASEIKTGYREFGQEEARLGSFLRSGERCFLCDLGRTIASARRGRSNYSKYLYLLTLYWRILLTL